jgi:hypothetical protein
MYLPIDFQVDTKNESKCYILKLNKSLYGLKQASLNWLEKLKQGLIDVDFIHQQLTLAYTLKRE